MGTIVSGARPYRALKQRARLFQQYGRDLHLKRGQKGIVKQTVSLRWLAYIQVEWQGTTAN